MAFEIKPFPEFSWSYSRHKTFGACQRQYYYTYYASHNGWLRMSDATQKQAYRLKKMQTLPLAIGQIVHDLLAKTIRTYFQTNDLLQLEYLEKNARDFLNTIYRNSTTYQHLWFEQPGKHPIFQEIHYFNTLDSQQLHFYNAMLRTYFENFFASKTMHRILHESVTFKQLEDFSYLRHDGIKIYVVLDLLYVDQQDDWHIVDWKTGKPSPDDREQLMLYAHYVHTYYNIAYEKIHLHLEYLASATVQSFQVNDKMLDNIFYLFEQSTHYMKALMADILTNEPLSEADFTANPDRNKCTRCNYLALCTAQTYFPSNLG